jgi:hypothetical protein
MVLAEALTMVRTWRWCKVFALFGEAVDVGEVCSGEVRLDLLEFGLFLRR